YETLQNPLKRSWLSGQFEVPIHHVISGSVPIRRSLRTRRRPAGANGTRRFQNRLTRERLTENMPPHSSSLNKAKAPQTNREVSCEFCSYLTDPASVTSAAPIPRAR